MPPIQLSFRSPLPAPADEVWAHAASIQGVNLELGPWLRMRPPRAARGLALTDLTPDRPALPFLLLLFGVLPFDRHALRIEQLVERGFIEESTSWLQRRWRHERHVEPTPEGCILSDTLTVQPRFLPAPLVRPIVQRLFAARHRKLQALFRHRSGRDLP